MFNFKDDESGFYIKTSYTQDHKEAATPPTPEQSGVFIYEYSGEPFYRHYFYRPDFPESDYHFYEFTVEAPKPNEEDGIISGSYLVGSGEDYGVHTIATYTKAGSSSWQVTAASNPSLDIMVHKSFNKDMTTSFQVDVDGHENVATLTMNKDKHRSPLRSK